jgi:type I restriction enzyme R subunit
VLTHHRLSDRGKRDLGLSDKNTPKLDPMSELGSGGIHEKEKVALAQIIEQLNTLFGSDATEGYQLSFARTLKSKTLESETLQKQAANNSKEQFANSPDLHSEIEAAVMDSMDAQSELSKKALNSEVILDGLKALMLNQLGLYEELKKKVSA